MKRIRFFLLPFLFSCLFLFSLQARNFTDIFSTDIVLTEYSETDTGISVLNANTLAWKSPSGFNILVKGYYDSINSSNRGGLGFGSVVPYGGPFYGELSYSLIIKEGFLTHRLYADLTREDSWGYSVIGIRSDFSDTVYLLGFGGLKNNFSNGFSLWNRYSLAYDKTSGISNGWWGQLSYQLIPVFALGLGVVAEWQYPFALSSKGILTDFIWDITPRIKAEYILKLHETRYPVTTHSIVLTYKF